MLDIFAPFCLWPDFREQVASSPGRHKTDPYDVVGHGPVRSNSRLDYIDK